MKNLQKLLIPILAIQVIILLSSFNISRLETYIVILYLTTIIANGLNLAVDNYKIITSIVLVVNLIFGLLITLCVVILFYMFISTCINSGEIDSGETIGFLIFLVLFGLKVFIAIKLIVGGIKNLRKV